MKRYEMEVKMDGDPGLYGRPVCEPVESQDGEWVRYEDIKHLLGDVSRQDQTLWLWKNFVDGKPEYWAFDNPFPTFGGGDPMTIGAPAAYAILKHSTRSPRHPASGDAVEMAKLLKRARDNSALPPRSDK